MVDQNLHQQLDELKKKLNQIEHLMKNSNGQGMVYFVNIENADVKGPVIDKLEYTFDKLDVKEVSGALNLGNNFGVNVEEKSKKKEEKKPKSQSGQKPASHKKSESNHQNPSVSSKNKNQAGKKKEQDQKNKSHKSLAISEKANHNPSLTSSNEQDHQSKNQQNSSVSQVHDHDHSGTQHPQNVSISSFKEPVQKKHEKKGHLSFDLSQLQRNKPDDQFPMIDDSRGEDWTAEESINSGKSQSQETTETENRQESEEEKATWIQKIRHSMSGSKSDSDPDSDAELYKTQTDTDKNEIKQNPEKIRKKTPLNQGDDSDIEDFPANVDRTKSGYSIKFD